MDIYSGADEFERLYVRPRVGRALIVGSRVYGSKEDRRLRHADAIGVDMLAGEGADLVADLEEELPAGLGGPFAHVECLSVLEHSRRPWLLAANVERLLEPGGTLFLVVPFVWRVHSYPSDYFRFTADGVRNLFSTIEWNVLLYGGPVGLTSDARKQGAKNRGGTPWFPRSEVFGFGVRR